jgi:hypothetical protein
VTNEPEICERRKLEKPGVTFSREPESDGVEERIDKGSQKCPGLGELWRLVA